MREVVQKVYKFNELSEEVQSKVVKDHRYDFVDDGWWTICPDEAFTEDMLHAYGFETDKNGVSFSLYDAEGGAGFTGTFQNIEYAIKVANKFDTEGRISDDVLDEIRRYGEVNVCRYSWTQQDTREWNTYVELLIDGNPMEEDEKYSEFIDALEGWRKEQCGSLYDSALSTYEYYTSDEYVRQELEEGNYEFLADGTNF